MSVSRQSLEVWLARAGIVFVVIVAGCFSYLVVGAFTGPGSQFVANSQYPLSISLPIYTNLNASATRNGSVAGILKITGETPVDHEIVAYQPINISIHGTYTLNGQPLTADSVSFLIAGALAGQPSGSATEPVTLSYTLGMDGKFIVGPAAGFYSTAGTFPIYVVDAIHGIVGTAQVPVEPPYLAQESTINHVELILSEAVFFFGIVESVVAIKELAPYAFP